jgi:ATP-binding cassette subfamily B protein
MDVLSRKLRSLLAQVRFLPRAASLVAAPVRGLWVAWIALLFAQGLAPAGVVLLSRPLVDGLAGTVGSGGDWTTLAPVAGIALVIVAILLLGEALRGAADWLRADLSARIEDHVSGLIHCKSIDADLAFYETPEFHDHLHRARDEARYRPAALLDNGGALVQHSVTLIAMSAVLLPYGTWMAVALLASTLPALIVVVRFALQRHRWRAQATGEERRAWYYDWMITASETAAELRLFGLGTGFRKAYEAIRARLRGQELALARRQSLAELGAGAAAMAITAACMAWIAWRAIQGSATIGDVALFYMSFSQGQRLMREFLVGIGRIYYNVLFLGNLFEFLDMPSSVRDPENPRECPPPGDVAIEVRFEDVTFRYPGTERISLRNFGLVVPAGQVAAIVGANGAGKSTLLKLLLRYYDPQAGRILLEGVDVRDMRLADVRSRVSALFQQPVRYSAPVTENVALTTPASRERIEAAVRACGAEPIVTRLPQGYDTLLGRWFSGGVELSVGEWQRLALARAVLRPGPLLVLDEPTSAMDSWAEAQWLEGLRVLVAGRTTIVVTHRFTTSMAADVIHVMDQGRIVESGSHGRLVERGGLYAQSWRAQMRAARGAGAPRHVQGT